jgi:hypothetical protein
MRGSAVQEPDWFGPTTYISPAPLPAAGDWAASFDPYGGLDYFWFSGQANRTVSVLVAALNDYSAPSENKAQPVIGRWQLSDPGTSPAPANTPSAFNSALFGTTVLNAQLLESTSFRVGIAAIRGDGRPDYRYHAPPVRRPHHSDPSQCCGWHGSRDCRFWIPGEYQGLHRKRQRTAAGSFREPDHCHDVRSKGRRAGHDAHRSAHDDCQLNPERSCDLRRWSERHSSSCRRANPPTPVGGQATNSIRVQALAPEGITPIAGASVFFTTRPAVSFSACSGDGSCTVFADQSGQASTLVSVLSAAASRLRGSSPQPHTPVPNRFRPRCWAA